MKRDPTTRRCLLLLAFLWLVVGLTDAAALMLGVTSGPIAVLIVEETEDRKPLTLGQREAILSNAPGSVRDYCKTHCEKDAAGVPEFRVLDKDDSVAKESPVIQELFAVKRDGVPWLVVKRGGTVVSEALPKTEAETLAMLQRYGGK